MTKGPEKNRGQAPAAPSSSERRIAARATVVMPVMCRYESVLDFVATQSMNISPTGMFIETEAPAGSSSISCWRTDLRCCAGPPMSCAS